MTDFQNPFIPGRIKKTISRVDHENDKGLIQRVTVTARERFSKTVVCDTTMDYEPDCLTGFIFRFLPQGTSLCGGVL